MEYRAPLFPADVAQQRELFQLFQLSRFPQNRRAAETPAAPWKSLAVRMTTRIRSLPALAEKFEVAGSQKNVAGQIDLHLWRRVEVLVYLDDGVAALKGEPNLVDGGKRRLAHKLPWMVRGVEPHPVGALLKIGNVV